MFFTPEPAETTNTKCIKPKRMDKKKIYPGVVFVPVRVRVKHSAGTDV